jgi:hypothetical protein
VLESLMVDKKVRTMDWMMALMLATAMVVEMAQ